MENIKETKIELGEELNSDVAKKRVIDDAARLDAALSGLGDEEKSAAFAEWREQYGLSEAQFKNATAKIQAQIEAEPAGNLEPSTIFQGLGILPVDQIVMMVDSEYPFSDLFPIETVKNGKKLVFYTDFKDADNLAAYIVPDDYVQKLYNPDQGKEAYEEWGTNLNIHKGLLIPSIAMNDFTSKETIFMALFNNYALQVAHAIAKVFYNIRLGLIQNPFDYLTKQDWSALTIDKSITGTTGYDVLTDLKTYLKSLGNTSRSNMPTRYIPKGFSNQLEMKVDASDSVLIVPIEFTSYIDTQLRSGAFNQEYLNLLPEFRAVDYTKTFVEYSGATNVKGGLTDFVAFLVPKKAASIIQHFEGSRAQPLLTLHSVIHTYHRTGRAIYKTKPIYNIEVKLNNAVAKTRGLWSRNEGLNQGLFL